MTFSEFNAIGALIDFRGVPKKLEECKNIEVQNSLHFAPKGFTRCHEAPGEVIQINLVLIFRYALQGNIRKRSESPW